MANRRASFVCIPSYHGVTRFVAEVLPENRAMLDVFRDGFDAHVACRDGVDRVEFPTSAWRAASERFPEQSQSEDPGAQPPVSVEGARLPRTRCTLAANYEVHGCQDRR